jgi:peptide/nickel transport system substrate-binding protein
MASHEFASRLNRRRMLRLFGAGLGVATASALAACSPSASPPAGQKPAAPAQPAAPAAPAAPPAPTAAAAKPAEAKPTEAKPAAAAPAKPAGAPKKGGVLNIGQDFGPQSLDPTKYSAWASTNVAELIYTALLRWDKDMKIEPDLATSWETPSPTTYVFKLRQGVKFHNGRVMTADDVKFTFDRIKDPATASPHQGIYEPLEKVEVVDPSTVRFTLKRPFAPFLRYLANIPHGAIVPKEAVDTLEKKPVGTGPFIFEEHVLDQNVRLKKNADYYEQGLPNLDGVVFKLLGDDTSISSALRSGSVDITWLKDPKVAQNVSKTTKGINSAPGVSSRYIPIMFKLTEKPFDDVRVRRAMSLALNRQQLVDTVLGGFGSVGTFLPPSQLAGYKGDGNDLPHYKQNVAEAKKLLAEAGHPNGLTVPEFKIVSANALDVQVAQLMKEQWAAAGINVTLNPMEVGAILKDWNSGTYSIAMVGTTWAADADAEFNRFNSKSPFGKAMGINDPKVDELIEAGRVESDQAKRISIYQQAQQLVLDQVYVIVPYTYPLRWELTWEHVKDYDVMASNGRQSVRKVWIDK